MADHSPHVKWEHIASIVVGSVILISAIRRGRILSPRTVTGVGLLARGMSGLVPQGRPSLARVR